MVDDAPTPIFTPSLVAYCLPLSTTNYVVLSRLLRCAASFYCFTYTLLSVLVVLLLLILVGVVLLRFATSLLVGDLGIAAAAVGSTFLLALVTPASLPS